MSDHVVCMGEQEIHTHLDRKPGEREPLRRSRYNWVANFTVGLRVS
jgi:hypothetical protein